jgi:hypothetical protein
MFIDRIWLLKQFERLHNENVVLSKRVDDIQMTVDAILETVGDLQAVQLLMLKKIDDITPPKAASLGITFGQPRLKIPTS